MNPSQIRGTSVVQGASGTQTITQPSATNLNIGTSGGGKLQYNGSEVLNGVNGIQKNPAASQSVVQPTGTTLNLNKACIATEDINARACFGATGTFSKGGICSISTGSASVSCTNQAVPASAVGNEVFIAGAGPSGNTLHTTIASVIDGNHFTVATAANTTVSGANMDYGVDDTSALINAYNAAVSTGKGLYIPSGVYLHHGLNWTQGQVFIHGDAYQGTYLIALAVTNPGRVNPSSMSVGVDVSATQYNDISKLTFYGGDDGMQDMAPTINFLAARAIPGVAGFFAINHVFAEDYWRTSGPYNVVLYGYEDTDFWNDHWESNGTVNLGSLYMSAINTPGFISPYVTVQPPTNSMTKVNISGGRSGMACGGRCVVLDSGNSESLYNISIRDVYFVLQSIAGTIVISDTGNATTSGLRHFVLDTINVEAQNCQTCQMVNINSPAWNWRIDNVQFYGIGQNNTNVYTFNNGILDSEIMVDSSGQSSGGASEISASTCHGTIIHAGQQQPRVTCRDYLTLSSTGDSAGFGGPATAPSGACSYPGQWIFSQDGKASYCNAGTWAVKVP